MSPALLFALLIIATPVLFFVVVPGVKSLVATAIPAKPAPALDERDLLDTDPREWVRQAEHAVEFEEGDKMDHMDSFMQIQRDIFAATISATNIISGTISATNISAAEYARSGIQAPHFTCVICGTHDVAHTHNLETTNHETRIDR